MPLQGAICLQRLPEGAGEVNSGSGVSPSNSGSEATELTLEQALALVTKDVGKGDSATHIECIATWACPESDEDSDTATNGKGARTRVRVWFCPAADLAEDQVKDTTGAGDAFIGSVCYGLAGGMPLSEILPLAAFVAGQCCIQLGPRTGLPRVGELPATAASTN